jgi:3'(2'), 5'-bisphosphate nucleotidase
MTRSLHTHAQLLEALIPIVQKAGERVMAVYGSDFAVTKKGDESPVTQADRDAEALITQALQRLTPALPIVAEEAVAAGSMPTVGERFWLVDPLDGTKEFISRNGEFTVNVALVEHGRATLGVVLAPALGELYAGGLNLGSWMERSGKRQPMACRQPPAQGLTVMASRSHGDAAALAEFLKNDRVADVLYAGSSLKLCWLARGLADVYPRLGRTMEWDIAAGHAVLAGAGGVVERLDGEPLGYGKPGFENPHFAAWGLRSVQPAHKA